MKKPSSSHQVASAVLAVIFAVVPLGIVLSASDCRPSATPLDADAAGLVEASAVVASDVCTLLEGVTSSSTLESVCATVEELGQIVAFVLTLRGLARADAGSTIPCQVLPGSSVCATKREIGQGVEFVFHARAARLARDGGRK